MSATLKYEQTHKAISRRRPDRTYQAYLVDLPDQATVEQSGNKEYGCLARWVIHAPGQSPAWEWYSITVAHLRNVDPRSKPDRVVDPGVTHEICCFANSPECSKEKLFAGAVEPLVPLNHVSQFECSDDKVAIDACEHLVELCVDGDLWLEPKGVRGAKDMWTDRLQQFITAAEAQRN